MQVNEGIDTALKAAGVDGSRAAAAGKGPAHKQPAAQRKAKVAAMNNSDFKKEVEGAIRADVRY